MSPGRPRRAIALALLVCALAPSTAVAQAPQRTNLADIEDEVMCLVCGTTLALSESAQADQERALIRGYIDQGLTKEEVKDRLVAEYGEEVLSTPGSSGFDLTAWVVPAIAFGLALLVAVIGIARRRGNRGAAEPPGLNEEESRRLDSELSRYDA